MTAKPAARLIIVGGFLGAGKTTLVWEAAQRLISKNQTPGLLDTVLFLRSGGAVAEDSGSCFSNDFNGLIDTIAEVGTKVQTKVIMVEAVGSCMDFRATIVPLLKDSYNFELTVAPLTIVVDPLRLSDLLEGRTASLPAGAAYLFRRQIDEAGIIVINKTNLLKADDDLESLQRRTEQLWPDASVFVINAKTGEGLDGWLDKVS
jgi:G3E family GTPase